MFGLVAGVWLYDSSLEQSRGSVRPDPLLFRVLRCLSSDPEVGDGDDGEGHSLLQ